VVVNPEKLKEKENLNVRVRDVLVAGGTVRLGGRVEDRVRAEGIEPAVGNEPERPARHHQRSGELSPLIVLGAACRAGGADVRDRGRARLAWQNDARHLEEI
jgi:hypothetical protein